MYTTDRLQFVRNKFSSEYININSINYNVHKQKSKCYMMTLILKCRRNLK